MTRKWFLGLLGIGAAGQTASQYITFNHEPPLKRMEGYRWAEYGRCSKSGDTTICTSNGGGTTSRKPANGECPVCGTMAESYVLSTAPQMFYDKVLGAWIDMGIPIQHPTRYATCAHCQVVFKQEAEEAK